MKKVFEGWYGGYYDDAGFYESKKDAERGYRPNEHIYEALKDFQGKRIKITVEYDIEPYIKETKISSEGFEMTLINGKKFLFNNAASKEIFNKVLQEEIDKIESV